MENGVMIMCGKCGATHGLLQECPSQKEAEMEERLEYGEPLLSKEDVAAALAHLKGHPATIRFKAFVWKVGTLGTGGVRVQLNLDQAYIKEMAMLADCQHELIELEFEAKQSED